MTTTPKNINEIENEMMMGVFGDVSSLSDHFIKTSLRKAGRVNSDILTPSKNVGDFNKKNDVIKKLDEINFAGKNIINIASYVLCAASQLEKGTAKLPQKEFVTRFKEQVTQENKRKIMKDEAGIQTQPKSDGMFDDDKTITNRVHHSPVSTYSME